MIFFITLFKYFINSFYSFHCLSFPFLEGCRLRERAHCARSVFPFIKKKKTKKLKAFFFIVVASVK